jgi:hypothetical protein
VVAGHGSPVRKNISISTEDVNSCKQSRNAEGWKKVTRYCKESAKFIYWKKRLSGGKWVVKEIWGNLLSETVELILLGNVTTGEELMNEVDRSMNREGERIRRRKDKVKPRDPHTFSGISGINPKASFEAKRAYHIIVEIIKEALAVFIKENPSYYNVLKEIYTASADEAEEPDETFDNDRSKDSIRRAYRAFRDKVLAVAILHRRDFPDDSMEANYMDQLIMYCENNPRGSQKFKEIVDDLCSMDDLFQSPRKKYKKRDREDGDLAV